MTHTNRLATTKLCQSCKLLKKSTIHNLTLKCNQHTMKMNRKHQQEEGAEVGAEQSR